jgi:hypothetical protein
MRDLAVVYPTKLLLACSNNPLGQRGGTVLAATLQVLTALVDLDIRYNLKMGCEGA